MLRSLRDLEPCTIDATDGDVGHVKDALFDDHAWIIRDLVVETGSCLASRKVLISPISVRAPDWAAHKRPVAITRAQVEHGPDIDTESPVSRQHESAYLGDDGYPAHGGGTGLWGGGMLPFSLHPPFAGVPGGPGARHAPMTSPPTRGAR